MAIYDLYGSTSDDLHAVRSSLEVCLGISFEERDSGYHGGVYYAFGDEAVEHLILKRNVDSFDGLAAESAFPESKILLYVNDTNRPGEFQASFEKLRGALTLLRHESL